MFKETYNTIVRRIEDAGKPAEEVRSKGYRFSRLAFWAVSGGFILTLGTIIATHIFSEDHEHVGELVKLYLYFAFAALLSLGVFAVKDVINLWTAGKFGIAKNGAQPTVQEQPKG